MIVEKRMPEQSCRTRQGHCDDLEREKGNGRKEMVQFQKNSAHCTRCCPLFKAYCMSIFALQSPAGGFLDEDMKHFNKTFDDWCVQFDNFEDAKTIADSFEQRSSVEIVEITPLSYTKYFFHALQGNIHATRQVGDKIVCIVEPSMGASFRLAVCDLKTKRVRLTPTRYKTALSVEGAFTSYMDEHDL